MKIDIFNHVLPPPLLEKFATFMPGPPVARWRSIKTLYDVDSRVRMLDEFGDYQQIISLGQPPLDEVAGPEASPELARIGNDGMAAMCKARPDRFPGFIASLPMNNPAAAVKEIDRAVRDLGALGVQIHSNVGGRALDQPEYFPVFDRMRQLDKPIWLHPGRPMGFADYASEDYSMYEIWWGLGWAYETSAAMARMVFSGMLDKLPGIKIIAHHWGAYIPHAEGRIPHWEGRSSQSEEHKYGPLKEKLKRPAMEYFKAFYADTAMFGARAASQAGLEFFGAAHSLFASDCPYDREGGRIFIRDTIKVMEELRCSGAEREQIYAGNARKMFGIR